MDTYENKKKIFKIAPYLIAVVSAAFLFYFAAHMVEVAGAAHAGAAHAGAAHAGAAAGHAMASSGFACAICLMFLGGSSYTVFSDIKEKLSK